MLPCFGDTKKISDISVSQLYEKVVENLPAGFRFCHVDWLTERDGDKFA